MDKGINWRFIIQNTLSLSVFSYLIFIGGRGDKIARSSGVLWLNIALLGVFALAGCLLVYQHRKHFGNSSYFGPLLILFAAAAISAWLSSDRLTSLQELSAWGMYIALGVVLLGLRLSGWNGKDMLGILSLLVALIILGKLWGSAQWSWNWAQNAAIGYPPIAKYRPSSPNLTAAVANILVMISIAYFLAGESTAKKNISIALAAAGMALVWVTSSRGGLLGSLGGALLIGLLVFSKQNVMLARAWRGRYRTHLIAGIVLGLGIMALLLGSVLGADRDSLSPRFGMWKLAIDMIGKNPIFGSGLYTYGQFAVDLFSIPPELIHTHAHSIYLNMSAEIGLLGLGAVLLLTWRYLKNCRRAYQLKGGFPSLAGAGAVGSFLAHGLVDTLYVEPYFSFIMAILLAATAPLPEDEQKARSKWIPWGIGIVLIASIVLGGFAAFIQQPLRAGVMKADHDKSAAVDMFQEALDRHPASALGLQQAALNLSYLGEEQIANRGQYIERAIPLFEAAIQEDPFWALNYANLGAIYASQGDLETALELFGTAVELADKSPLLALNYGYVAEITGDLELAEQSYRKYLTLRGEDPTGPFWEETNFRRALSSELMADSLSIGDDLQDALAAVADDPFDTWKRLSLASAYLERGSFSEAETELNLADLAMGPRGGIQKLELSWLRAEAAIQQGDLPTAIMYAEEALRGWHNQSGNGPGTYRSSEYSQKLYRAPMLADDLGPGILREPLSGNWFQRKIQLGDWYLLAGDYNQAESTFLEILEMDPDNAQAAQGIEQLDRE